ncbi:MULTISPECIES: aldehyde dehydrogenase family protein [Streptomyces]|uniref:aldehyde dehydrogenase family protein n=1 Tax=Streptomyces TaxID=1883 RepID=UPI00163C2FFA|nr:MULTISPECIES: aldehyde dehydrogenase family protein [Streptomyces]MBC2876051.1 aldehyde dehydrogenase family protein [Streptomyces sp. TYQ1024]UBI38412.1 aldehyde dehydrogenase family protein [Streptomyces mobaraensis]UKW30997.1 aldehyde dehydrogenase family protein [Streptomyces sp. TYQ1024]
MPGSPALLPLDALGPGGPYRTQARETVHDVTGRPVAELSVVPRLYVRRALAALRRAETPPLDERTAALAEAARLFATATIDGMSVERYEHTVARVGGLPVSVVRQATGTLATGLAGAYGFACQARPRGSRDVSAGAGTARWIRRGDVLSVLAAGNHPGIHAQWVEALALGYRVAVRPSRREPLSAHRLVTALHEAGFGTDHVALLPTDHGVADELVTGGDLALVYGGDAVVDKYASGTTVLPHGPGRAKILITADTDFTRHLDTIVDSIGAHAGASCVNTTAVFVEGDPAPVAEAVADRLARLPSLPPEDDEAALPVQRLDEARTLEKYVRAEAAGATARLGGDTLVHDLGDGAAVLRPAVFQVDRADAPQTRLEMPFPCVWIAPWSRADGLAPLRDTLVLTALTSDRNLVARLLDEPAIRNLHVGDHPTHVLTPGLPHDGYFGEFLMRGKTFTTTPAL